MACAAVAPAPFGGGGQPQMEPATTLKMHPKNHAYFREVSEAVVVIKGKWPDIETVAPLEVSVGGFLAPYSAEGYAASFQKDGRQEWTCGMNALWANPLLSVTPHVPISKNRVLERAGELEPGKMLRPDMLCHANFQNGADLPRGGLVQMCLEVTHPLMSEWLNVLQVEPPMNS